MIRIVLAMIAALAAGSALAATPQRIDDGRLGQIRYYRPDAGRTVEGVVALISDRAGWDDATDRLAQHIVGEGHAVLGIDLKTYAATLAKDDDDCSWVNTEFEILSRKIEKGLPFRSFHPPVIVGLGSGGAAVAYAVIGQALPNTFMGAIGIGFTPNADIGRTLCLSDAVAKNMAVRYAPVTDRETPWLFTPAADFTPDMVRTFQGAMSEAHTVDATGDTAAIIDDALARIPELNAFETPKGALPIVEVPTKLGIPANLPMVVFYSGDGGWRDIDKQIGGYLADHGFFTLGFDSLRYFWREKQPREMAADLDVLLRRYEAQAKGGVILVGYSFGADLLPFIVNRMAPDLRRNIRLVSLLGLSQRASFEIRLDGILGAHNEDGPLILPELLKIRDMPIQCVFGAEETDSICKMPALDSIVRRVAMSGGHHFDGGYEEIAEKIIAAAKPK